MRSIRNAHILRELDSLIEFDHEVWAELLRALPPGADLAVNTALRGGRGGARARLNLKAFVERYRAAVRLGLAFHRELPEPAADPVRANEAPARL